MPEKADLEIVVSPAAGYSHTGYPPLEKAKDAFQSLAATIKDVLVPVHQALADSAADEVELRLELAFKGEAKWVVISAGGQATVGLKLLWKK